MLSQQTIDTVKSTVPLLADKGEEITANFYARMFANHPELENVFNMSNQRSNRQSSALAGAVFAYANNIDNIEALVPAVKRIASKHASIGITPEQYPIVGKYLLQGIQDVLQLPDDHEALRAWGEAYGVLADIFIETEEGMYSAHENQPGGWRGFRPFVIEKVVTETPEVKSFYFKATDGQAIESFLGGQYIGIKVKSVDGGNDQIRQYSLSSWGDKDYYRISVKAEKQGAISQYLHGCKQGDTVELSPPNGEFILNKDAAKHVFISAGVGITPLYSMLLESLSLDIDAKETTFIVCAEDEEHQIFREPMHEICEQKGITLKRALKAGGDCEGYLDATVLNEWLDDKNADVYLCGPLQFMKSNKEILNEIGFSDEQIHYEVFGPTEDI